MLDSRCECDGEQPVALSGQEYEHRNRHEGIARFYQNFEGNWNMETGIVKWFNDAKGFGFITSDAGGEDLFAHFSEIRSEGFKSLKENQRVSFEVKTGPKGKHAANIQPL